jgi:hypothetical protein
MRVIIFTTQNGVFKFDQKEVKEIIRCNRSKYDLDDLVWGSNLRLTFKDIAFNMFEAVFKFSILLQLCFHTCNRAADRTVLV